MTHHHRARPALACRGTLLLACVALTLACSTTPQEKQEAIYGPTESVLEVVAVLRRHVPDDTYRFPPATDFTGRNVYRASLLRLESLEQLHGPDLRAGHMDAVIAFAKGRALERLRAYDLAAAHYRSTAEREGNLKEEALRSEWVCERLAAAVKIGIDLEDPLARDLEAKPLSTETNEVIATLDERVGLLTTLATDARAGGHYYYAVIREEIERADVTRARYMVSLRHLLPGGQVRAVGALQRVIARHAASHHRRRHMLALANLYASLAEEYVEATPPESLLFDPPRFEELVDAAAHIYESVATQDGVPEKLEAARRLESFLAFTLQVDRDRFTQ
jgi:hypothetical protein